MENIWERERTRTGSISSRLSKLEEEIRLKEMRRITKDEQEEFKFPWKWKSQMNKATKKKPSQNKVLAFYLNVKGEMEPPLLVPLFSGNIIIYRNKAHIFDPRDTWLVNLPRRRMIKCILIREIDRRLVSNRDFDEVKKEGYATDSDEILLKMVTKAMIEKVKKSIGGKGIAIAIAIAIAVIVGIFFIF